MAKKFTFEFIEKHVRKKTFGILSTKSSKGWTQSSGVLYGVTLKETPFRIYIMTSKDSKKVQNVKDNPKVSFLIPFPHYYLRFVPSSTIQFQGIAELLSPDDREALDAFQKGPRILRGNVDYANRPGMQDEVVFIRIKPNSRIACYGLGISLRKLAKDVASGAYSVKIPPERL